MRVGFLHYTTKTNGWNLKIPPKGKGETFTVQTITNFGFDVSFQRV